MSKKTGTARAEQPEPPLPKHFSFRPDEEFNVQVREYLIGHNVSFNDLCDAALREFIANHPRWPHRSLRLPRGRRPTL